jgi:hypothetical protein
MQRVWGEQDIQNISRLVTSMADQVLLMKFNCELSVRVAANYKWTWLANLSIYN